MVTIPSSQAIGNPILLSSPAPVVPNPYFPKSFAFLATKDKIFMPFPYVIPPKGENA